MKTNQVTHKIFIPGHLFHDDIGIWVDGAEPYTRKENEMPRQDSEYLDFVSATREVEEGKEKIVIQAEVIKAQDVMIEQLRKSLSNAKAISDMQTENFKTQAEIISRMQKFLRRSVDLLQRSKRIIQGQVPGVPHTIETSLEELTIDIEGELERTS